MRLAWRLLLFLAVAILVAALVGLALPGGIQTGSAATLAGALAGGWVLLAMDGRDPGALGFYLSRDSGREAALGLGMGVAVALVVVAVMALAGGLRWSTQGGTVSAWLLGAIGSLAFLTLPAAAEEALLRGYPLQALAESWGAPAALIVTSIAFGALHMNNPEVSALGLANVMVAGLFLGAVYLKTGSLWLATGVHLGWNWAHGYLVDLPVSGLELIDAPFYEGVAQGPAWLGGGAFGPEGSVLATLVVLSATVACWWGPWLRPGETALGAAPLALGAHGSRGEAA